jgi:hypothetical protein
LHSVQHDGDFQYLNIKTLPDRDYVVDSDFDLPAASEVAGVDLDLIVRAVSKAEYNATGAFGRSHYELAIVTFQLNVLLFVFDASSAPISLEEYFCIRDRMVLRLTTTLSYGKLNIFRFHVRSISYGHFGKP